MISDDTTDSLVPLLKVSCKIKFHQRGIIVSLHRRLKVEKTKLHTHSLQNSRQNLSFEGVRSLKLVQAFTYECFRKSRDYCFQNHVFWSGMINMNYYVIVQVFARFGKISGFVWS